MVKSTISKPIILLTFICCCLIPCIKSDYEVRFHKFDVQENQFNDAELNLKFNHKSLPNTNTEYFSQNHRTGEHLLLILPSFVAKRIVNTKVNRQNTRDLDAKLALFDHLQEWINSTEGREVSIISCFGFSAHRPCARIINNVIYNLRHRNEAVPSSDDYIRVYYFGYMKQSDSKTDHFFERVQDFPQLTGLIEPFDMAPIAKITIYSITNGDFTSVEEELLISIDDDNKESYVFLEDDPETHFRWIIVPSIFYHWLTKDQVNQDILMHYIDDIKYQNLNLVLEFKLLVIHKYSGRSDRSKMIESTIMNHWPNRNKSIIGYSKIFGIDEFDRDYLISSETIEKFEMPGLINRLEETHSSWRKRDRSTKFSAYNFEENHIELILEATAFRSKKEGETYIVNNNVLLLLVPRDVVEKLLKFRTAEPKAQLINFVKELKRLSNGIDVKLVSYTINDHAKKEMLMRQFLIEYGKYPSSSYVTIYVFGPCETDEHGYPTFVDEVYSPFSTYTNPSLNEFFLRFHTNNPFFLTESMATVVPRPSPPTREAPWNHDIERDESHPAVYIYSMKDEIRELDEGDYVPIIEYDPYQPHGNDKNYKYIKEPDPNAHYLFIMITEGLMRNLLSKPKRTSLKPKRREFFDFVRGIKNLSNNNDKSKCLEVKVFAWSGINDLNMFNRTILVLDFLDIHAPDDGRDPKTYINVFGFDELDFGDGFLLYTNEELIRFLSNIANENVSIDSHKATGIKRRFELERRPSDVQEQSMSNRQKNYVDAEYLQAAGILNNLTIFKDSNPKRDLIQPSIWFDDEKK